MKKYGIGLLTVLLGLCLTGHAAVVAHYTFDTEAGITNDVSGNGHDLLVYSGSPGYTTNSIIGEGATVMNSGGVASDGWRTPAGILTPSFTFAAWVKPEGTSSMVVQPISMTTGYQIYIAGGIYRVATMSAEGTDYKPTTASPTIGVWQHVALTYTATNGPDGNGTYTGTLTAYVDGSVVGTLEGARYAAPSSNYQILGLRSSAFFNGVMDDVYIYDTALSGLEIQKMAAEGKPLVAHYTFDTEAGITNDVSGNGHDLLVYSGSPGYTTNSIIGEGATVMNSGGIASDGWRTDAGILTPSFTFAAWLKPEGTSSMVVQPISMTTGYQIYIAGGIYRVATMSAEGTDYKPTTASPTIGVWQHVALTYTATNGPDGNGTYTGTLTAYVDGSVVGTLEGARYAAPSSNYQLLGLRSTAFLNGLMDDVYIYRTALSGLEIQKMAAEGKPVIAHYTFDDPENVGADDSGNGNDLSVYSGYGTPGYTTGLIGDGATVFNSGDTASDGWITGTGILTPSFTFAAWVKPVGTSSMLLQPWSFNSGYEVYFGSTYRYALLSAEPMSYTVSTTAPAVGSWQHIAITFNATNGPDANGTYTGTLTTYIDGEVDTTKEGATYAVDSGNFLALGRRATQFFNGVIDDMYLYRTALTQGEVQALYDLAPKGYAGWAEQFGGTNVIGAATNDYDGDGLINLYEYGLGGNPTNALDRGISPQYGIVDQGGTTYFGYVYPQLADANSGLTYSLETSTNLVSGTWTNAGYTVLGTNAAGTFNMVSNYTDTVDSQKFIRLMISTNTPAN